MTRGGDSCAAFRALLEAKLEGGRAPARRGEERLGTLAWHAHLLACEGCRELLAAEQALEILLATLPEPRLSPELAERVLVRLRAGRAVEAELDALLDLDSGPRVPERLAPRILARLAHERAHGEQAASRARDHAAAHEPAAANDLASLGEPAPAHELAPDREPAPMHGSDSVRELVPARASDAASLAMDRRLDVLLDAADVDVPEGLARRVLVALGRERVEVRTRDEGELVPARLREAPSLREEPVPARRRRSFAFVALAAAVLVALGLAWWTSRRDSRDADRAPVADRGAVEERGGEQEADENRNAPQLVRPQAEVAGNGSPAAPDTPMLEALGVLEQWDLLMQSDVDVLLSTLDATEPLFLDFEPDSAPLEPETKEAAPPSKG